MPPPRSRSSTHLDPPRLAAFERVLFECGSAARGGVTDAEREYNVHWSSLPAGCSGLRPSLRVDARELQAWATGVARAAGIRCASFRGPEDPHTGARHKWRCSPARRQEAAVSEVIELPECRW